MMKMKVQTIRATSRLSVKVGNNFYTEEYTEERLIEDGDDVEKEREKLWETVNDEVDKQVEIILNANK